MMAMARARRTPENSAAYDGILVAMVQANWDEDEERAGPYYGLLAEGLGYRVHLVPAEPKVDAGQVAYPVVVAKSYMRVETNNRPVMLKGLMKQLGLTNTPFALANLCY
jgi:hypothetical protein